jgi:pimeloyl-ACP methyl ester carboxylesterase
LLEHWHIQINGKIAHAMRAGAGEDIVLLHGLGGPMMWQKVITPLAENFRVTVIDFPGFGDSQAASHELTVDDHAEFARAVLDRIGIRQAAVAGISYGGQVAAHFAANYPACASRLMLLCPSGLKPTPFIASDKFIWNACAFTIAHTVQKSEKLLCRAGARSFYDIRNRPEDLCKKFFEQLSRPGGRASWANAARNVLRGREALLEKFSLLTMPCTILWGENDVTVPVALAGDVHERIAGSRLRIIPRCAHSIPLEHPQAVLEELEELPNCS